MRKGGGWTVAVVTGVLLVVSFPPLDWALASFVALVPLCVYIIGAAPGAEGRSNVLRVGYTTGLVYFGLLLYWILPALWDRTALVIPGYALVIGTLACLVALFSVALHGVAKRGLVSLPVAVAVLWTGMEWLQGHLGDLSFPWLGLGAAMAPYPRLAGAADLVGTGGLTFWLALVNGLIAHGILEARAGRSVVRPIVAVVIAITIPIGYGVWRAEQLELVPAARVAIVQPNISQELKLRRVEAIDSTRVAVATLVETLSPGSVDLVVLPEVTFPTALESPAEYRLVHSIATMSESVGAPFLVGAYGERDSAYGPGPTNAAFVVDSGGLGRERYDKHHLVPFIERTPFMPRWAEQGWGEKLALDRLLPGIGAPAFETADTRYGVLICFESTFAPHARRYLERGADYLVNMTNDAWFGGGEWFSQTSALWQHPAHATLRAIELRTGVVRAANTGISMVIDPTGRAREQTEPFVTDIRKTTVYTTNEQTVYERWGHGFAGVNALFALLLILVGRVDRDY